jgi:cytochrome c peroxidase
MKTKIILSFFLVSVFFASCVQDKVQTISSVYSDEEYELISQYLNLPTKFDNYHVILPDHLSVSLFPLQVDNKKATLGRVLFYDKNLSKNRSVSCASCHSQELAFADNKAFSEGFNGELTERNSLALGSVVNFSAYYGSEANPSGIRFFWDERAGTVGEQSEMTLSNQIEMGMEMHEVTDRLEELEYYKPIFNAVYGSYEITEKKVLDAITDFILGMGSYNATYDQNLANPNWRELFTARQNLGMNLYNLHCQECHGRHAARPFKTIANNGLDENYTDKGVGALEDDPEKEGLFKVPTLRNIALTAPYMHDGRFETLEEVIDHYSQGIQDHRNLDHSLKEYRNGEFVPKRMDFSEEEKQALIHFLHTLTDEEFIHAEKFSDPFK